MIARPNVPNLFAVSPFLAMRSAPTTTASIRPRPKRLATAASGSTACAMPSRPSSHAVRRAPCSSGRVSGTQTNGSRPSACNRRTTPNAVTCAIRSPKHPCYRLCRSAHPLQTIRHRAHPPHCCAGAPTVASTRIASINIATDVQRCSTHSIDNCVWSRITTAPRSRRIMSVGARLRCPQSNSAGTAPALQKRHRSRSPAKRV